MPDSALWVHHDKTSWSVDATTMGVAPEALDQLPWTPTFNAMAALESGAIANPDEQRQVGHYWLRSPERSGEHQGAIEQTRDAVLAFAKAVREGVHTTDQGETFTHALQLGIGGSALGPQLLVEALGEGEGLELHFVDNIDPDGLQRTLDRIGAGLSRTLIVAVSKSGGTPETMLSLDLVLKALQAQGLSVSDRLVAITGDDSKLHRRAQSEGWRATFPLFDWVGGRTSVGSVVGLLPGALAGLDMAAFLEGSAFMDAWTRADDWRKNPAALLAGCWHAVGHGKGDRAMVVLPYADRLLWLSRYLQQLVMESLGKRHALDGREVEQGLVVYGNKGSTDQHAFVQQLRDGRNDFFVSFVSVLEDGRGPTNAVDGLANAGDVLQGMWLGTRKALDEADRPSLVITLPRVGAFELGALIALFERAVGFYASLVGINAYHQPGVEAGKKAAKGMVALQAKVLEGLGSEPTTAEALAGALGEDAGVVFHMLMRLSANGRIARDGFGFDARFVRS
ncbi:MAG: glucose-6-phosphate isomerase [Myxococcota bacterium]